MHPLRGLGRVRLHGVGRRSHRQGRSQRLLCAFLAGCGGGEAQAEVESYVVDAAGTTVTLEVIARPGATTRAEVISQDSTAVVVKVRVTEPEGTNLDLGQRYPVSVKLKSPLGSRAIRTNDDVTVPTATPTPT